MRSLKEKHLEAERYGVSVDYWTRLSIREQDLYRTIAPLPQSRYEVDVHLHMMRKYLEDVDQQMKGLGGGLELNPDFQPGHVWTEKQRVRFVESALAGRGAMLLVMNIPNFSAAAGAEGDIPSGCAQCIDGLQRVTTMLDFTENKLEVFGSLKASDLAGTTFDMRRMFYKVRVFEFVHRRELLEYYLAINSGGTVHTDLELDRVRTLLSATKP